MADRNFNEIDLRDMLNRASAFRPDSREGRWIVTTVHSGRSWEVVVEPDSVIQLLIVVTAYPLE